MHGVAEQDPPKRVMNGSMFLRLIFSLALLETVPELQGGG